MIDIVWLFALGPLFALSGILVDRALRPPNITEKIGDPVHGLFPRCTVGHPIRIYKTCDCGIKHRAGKVIECQAQGADE